MPHPCLVIIRRRCNPEPLPQCWRSLWPWLIINWTQNQYGLSTLQGKFIYNISWKRKKFTEWNLPLPHEIYKLGFFRSPNKTKDVIYLPNYYKTFRHVYYGRGHTDSEIMSGTSLRSFYFLIVWHFSVGACRVFFFFSLMRRIVPSVYP